MEARTLSPAGQLGTRLRTAAAGFSLPALGAVLIWSVNPTAMKVAVAEIDPYLIGIIRMYFAGFVMLIALFFVEGWVWVAPRHWPRLLLCSAVGKGVNAICWQVGIAKSTASNSALISSMAPVMALAIALALRQEKLVRRRVLGMAVAMAGVALVMQAHGFDLRAEGFVGDLLLLGSALSWAFYNVSAVPLLHHNSPLKVTAWTMLLGATSLLVFSPWLVSSWDVSQASLAAWAGVGYTSFVGSVVAMLMWNRAVSSLGATGTLIYSYLSPVLAVAVAAALLGERLSFIQATGAAFVLAGVALSVGQRGSRAKAASREGRP